jgi:RND family efflux transporter MFP subunit
MKPPAAGTPVSVGMANDDGYPYHGVVDFMDNQVNPQTGTIGMRAVLANRDGKLVPGMFARVRMQVGPARQALLVPDSAVRSDRGEKYVYIVDEKNQVVMRPITIGARHDELRVIEKGVRAGDRIVTDALTTVRPGMTVMPKPEATPTSR